MCYGLHNACDMHMCYGLHNDAFAFAYGCVIGLQLIAYGLHNDAFAFAYGCVIGLQLIANWVAINCIWVA